MTDLQILEAYTEAYKIVKKALNQTVSGTMPVFAKVNRIIAYIDAQAKETLQAIEAAPEDPLEQWKQDHPYTVAKLEEAVMRSDYDGGDEL